MTKDTNNVVKLKAVQGGKPLFADPPAMLIAIRKMLNETNILADYEDEDVELEKATGDETELGKLTPFERECYVIGMLLEQIIKDEMIEIEADNATAIADIMRRDRVIHPEAAHKFIQETGGVSAEQRTLLNQCAVTLANVKTMYEWGVRARYDEWTHNLIVRRGFVAYFYG